MSTPFEGDSVANYHEGPRRQVPGYDGLLRMTTQLLAEEVQQGGNILVLGAGGGLEIRAMAETHASWQFEGIDPSQDMLDLAAEATAAYAHRIHLRSGYIEDASRGPFDGATCILTMHFITQHQRLDTLREIRQRLAPGAPFVMAHISFPQDEPERSTWLNRHIAYSGTPADRIESAREAISTRLTILSPEHEVSLLHEAGFTNIQLFYAGLSFRGWVANAG